MPLLEARSEPLAPGTPLSTLPLRLDPETAPPPDLERSDGATCASLRIETQ